MYRNENTKKRKMPINMRLFLACNVGVEGEERRREGKRGVKEAEGAL